MSKFYVHSIPSSYSSADLVFLTSITPVHAGIGRVGGIVDLPIQRDEYGYPSIYSSSIKGALKTALLNAFMNRLSDYRKARKAVMALLGPEPEEGESFESSIAILDAYLFAMPVRSLRGVYAYTTSPFLLRRFCDRLEFMEKYQGTEKQSLSSILRKSITEVEDKLAKDLAVCIGSNKECESIQLKESHGKALLVEEALLEINDAKNIMDKKQKEALIQLKQKLDLEKPILILHDDVAREIINRSLIKLTRVRLKRETKTVEEGPWTEEYIPPKTVLHTLVLYKKTSLSQRFIRDCVEKSEEAEIEEDDYLNCLKKLNVISDKIFNEVKSANNILEKIGKICDEIRNTFKNLITNILNGYLILGGHETIGKGIVRMKFLID